MEYAPCRARLLRVPDPRFVRVGLAVSSLFAPSQLPNASVSSADLSGLRGEFFASITHRRPKQVIAFPLHRVHRSSGFTPLAFSRSRAALFTLSCEAAKARAPDPHHRQFPVTALRRFSTRILPSLAAALCPCSQLQKDPRFSSAHGLRKNVSATGGRSFSSDINARQSIGL